MNEKLFYLDMLLEVMDEDGQTIFIGRVDDMSSDSLQLIDPGGRDLPPAIYGDTVRLKGFHSGSHPFVATAKIRGSTPEFWQLEDIKSTFFQENRANFRQRVYIQTEFLPMGNIFAYGDEDTPVAAHKPLPCRVLDMSATGLLMSCSAKLQVDDIVYLPDVTVLESVAPFSLTCRVCRQGENRYGNLYGCQFENLTGRKQERLLQALFVLQREELKKKRNR